MVDDIDPQGKVSLSLVGERPAPTGNGAGSARQREPAGAASR